MAVELAKRIFGNLANVKVLLVGAGEMAELSAKYLKKLKAHLFITNRTYERAVELAKELEGNVLRFEELADYLHEFDIVIVSTGSKKYIIDYQMVKKAIKKRGYKPIFFIDISVPRNVDPAISQIDEVFLYDIDDLQDVAEKNLKERLKEKEKGEIIVWDEVGKFMKWLQVLEVEDIIIRIKESWSFMQDNNPMLKRLIHKAIEEIRKDPSLAEKLVKIFLQEVEDANTGRKLSYVHNRANGA